MELRALVLALAAAVTAQAQQYKVPAFEVSGGFTTVNWNGAERYYGPSGAFMANLNRRVGIVAEGAALFGETEVFGLNNIPADVDPTPDRSVHTLMAGPRVRLLTQDRFTLSAHALAGWGRISTESFTVDDDRVPSPIPDVVNNRVASAVGVTLDFRLSNRVAWRLQPESLWIEEVTGGNTFRFSTGLVFRFGSR